MPTHTSEMFIYDNIHFENGRKDKSEHPVIIAGVDEDNVYCFAMTSQTKHIGKNSQIRNLYNSTIKYCETIPGKNCTTNNFIRGLVNTTQCIKVPIAEAREYPKFGFATGKLLEDIIAKWVYQQENIADKPQFEYQRICEALGVTRAIKHHPTYRACEQLMNEYPNELQLQRDYSKALRLYREECNKIRRENINSLYRGSAPLQFPKEPKLQDDKSYYEKYSTIQLTDEEKLANSPFAGLAEQLFGNAETKEEQAKKPIDFTAKKQELLQLKQMLQETQSQEQGQSEEYETHHGRRAA